MIPAATFEARGGPEVWIAARLRTRSPRAVAVAVGMLGYLMFGIVLATIGLILTKLLIPGPVGAWDNSVNEWCAAHRTSSWNTVTDYASILAGTGTVLLVAGTTAGILAFRRLWREIGFLLVGFFIELSVFLTAVLLVDRPRPSVPKLDGVPATSSFPSGHVAAAIVLYAGIAILISAHARNIVIRATAWAIAVSFVVGVGVSRIYRGLHHPIDVFAGAVLGIGALLFAILAIRAADASSRARARYIRLPHERWGAEIGVPTEPSRSPSRTN